MSDTTPNNRCERSITVTAMRRPQLFRKLLTTLLANDLGGWRLVIRVEPGDRARDFVAIAEALLDGVEYDLRVNPHVTGITLNPFLALEAAFAAQSQLNLYLEEDFVVSPDATRLALWYQREHRPGWFCLSLLAGPCGSTGLMSNRQHPELLFAARTFNSIGFVMRREEWYAHARTAWLGKQTMPSPEPHANWRYNWGWDWSLYGLVASSPTLRVIQPVLARATHTGRLEGTHASPEFHDAAFGSLPLNFRKDVCYRLTDIDQLPHEVRAHIRLQDELTTMRLELEQLARRTKADPGHIVEGKARQKRGLAPKVEK